MTADIIDGIAVTDLQLIDEVGSVGGTVTFVKNVTFLGGLNGTTGVLDECDILEVSCVIKKNLRMLSLVRHLKLATK